AVERAEALVELRAYLLGLHALPVGARVEALHDVSQSLRPAEEVGGVGSRWQLEARSDLPAVLGLELLDGLEGVFERSATHVQRRVREAEEVPVADRVEGTVDEDGEAPRPRLFED